MTHLTPLLIRTFGRTGSTLLMQVLGTSERVCFERKYPFEHRYLTYVHHLARMIGTPHENRPAWNNDVLFTGRHDAVGALPYGRIDALDRESLAERAYVALWEQFSESLRAGQGLAPGAAGFYAEKAPAEVADRANRLLRGRNIFLLRDPRDEMVSIRSFNAKRGFRSFGWLEQDDELSFATKMCEIRRPFLRNLIDFETSERRISVRYEDLVLDGPAEVERLSDWLGSPMSFGAATRDKEIKARHMTSKDPAASVERWREELEPAVHRIFAERLGAELTELGYRV